MAVSVQLYLRSAKFVMAEEEVLIRLSLGLMCFSKKNETHW